MILTEPRMFRPGLVLPPRSLGLCGTPTDWNLTMASLHACQGAPGSAYGTHRFANRFLPQFEYKSRHPIGFDKLSVRDADSTRITESLFQSSSTFIHNRSSYSTPGFPVSWVSEATNTMVPQCLEAGIESTLVGSPHLVSSARFDHVIHVNKAN